MSVLFWLLCNSLSFPYPASLPGMFERTVTMGSAGKTLSATGWKLGWGIGPEHLIAPMQVLHQNCTYNCPTPVQVRNKCFYWKISMHDAWITVFQCFFFITQDLTCIFKLEILLLMLEMLFFLWECGFQQFESQNGHFPDHCRPPLIWFSPFLPMPITSP